MRYIVGIDEVGRGPLAGPVVVCAVCIPATIKIYDTKLGTPIDSKKLSEKQREAWFKILTKSKKLSYAVAQISPRKIDKINISAAANLAAKKVFQKLVQTHNLSSRNCSVFLDGGLYIGTKTESLRIAKTIIKGDQKIKAISMASIIAKVTRDRLMVRLGKKYPKYGFEKHKGYGTALHMKAIKKYGAIPLHRRTFLPLTLRKN